MSPEVNPGGSASATAGRQPDAAREMSSEIRSSALSTKLSSSSNTSAQQQRPGLGRLSTAASAARPTAIAAMVDAVAVRPIGSVQRAPSLTISMRYRAGTPCDEPEGIFFWSTSRYEPRKLCRQETSVFPPGGRPAKACAIPAPLGAQVTGGRGLPAHPLEVWVPQRSRLFAAAGKPATALVGCPAPRTRSAPEALFIHLALS